MVSPVSHLYPSQRLLTFGCCSIHAVSSVNTYNGKGEHQLLKQEGVNAAYSLYDEAGVGFAEHVCAHMEYCKQRHGQRFSLS